MSNILENLYNCYTMCRQSASFLQKKVNLLTLTNDYEKDVTLSFVENIRTWFPWKILIINKVVILSMIKIVPADKKGQRNTSSNVLDDKPYMINIMMEL